MKQVYKTGENTTLGAYGDTYPALLPLDITLVPKPGLKG